MKKLLTLTAVGAILAAPATAVQRCVALSENNNDFYIDDYEYSEWTLKSSNITIKGIGLCTGTSGAVKETSDTLLNYGGGYYCWCRMISPAVSSWFSSNFEDNDDYICATNCSLACAELVRDDAEFRSALFTTVSN
ncbi:MAG: hypothetical protein IKB05_01110 [Alphaproteobacteria bacterium]|nr:hypothetical protein [Alphaproteobacteria bacterium]